LDKAFAKGTHCRKEDYAVLAHNTETLVMRGPDGQKRTILCLPGSVRVSSLVSCGGGGGGGGISEPGG